MLDADHQWMQCRDPACRLRFPAPVAALAGLACPTCGGPLDGDGPGAGGPGTTATVVGEVDVARGDDAANVAEAVGEVGRDAAGPRSPAGVVVAGLLDNVRSVLNVGAILRTADAAGLAHVHLAGITPRGDHARIDKTALGAQHAVAWSHHPDGPAVVADLQAGGWQVWALEEGGDAEPLARASADLHAQVASASPDPRTRVDTGAAPDGARIVVVVGHEVAGVDPAILAAADRHVAIPMRGTKRSLNVSIAFGIAVYALTTPASPPFPT